MYVSVTGLRVKSVWHLPRFWWHALRSFRQAQQAEGVISVAVRNVDGVQHTLTCWPTRKHMLAFMRGGAHLQAIRAFREIATGSTIGFEADAPPSWDEALAKWKAEGRDY